ncbi:prolyl oligopeptidase family serine peptidase [Xanthomonas cucurbitae]|uniref:Prolyl oligopeptidase family serine peptidase n=2 Tax=Xanthomonas TaxID=338 RepID=A0A2S7DPF1_9XANT|nr:prolyl oligopeptidase family serine peptidase [Xanthomonas cucurbitae]PPU75711.1 S9 family peptidase [Xanthomonas cucurbitae]QHG89206.1 S9 family peptidase [Xanthomonas cucurbitae]WDM69847.1 prolyl oligopeptidase family serine peptidase [Xanthomonas cucurbitae]WDM73718.1 prolyl oligopeptidase family serine peptidase [Xanthomonas cucurbitae]WDM77440.1 prolyl oligopeptidase family serine peptidase [Xanthomonas cucurbitae]
MPLTPKHTTLCATFVCLFGIVIADAAPVTAATTTMPDRYLWLEDVTGTKALDWVKQQDARTEKQLADTADFKQLEAGIREVMDSDTKIPYVQKIGADFYNFWQDKDHKRGIWRRTTPAEYRKPSPKWETVLDLDALNQHEGKDWTWQYDKVDCLRPAYRRCLITLSRGGSDADVTREFDLIDKRWVEGGFVRPEAKGALSWVDQDTVYVSTDFGAGSTTDSGYPRIVKQWKRGTALTAASMVYTGKQTDIRISAFHDATPGFERDIVVQGLGSRKDAWFLRGRDGTLTKVEAPDSATKQLHRQWLTLELREPWTVGGTTYPVGALLATRFDAFMAGKRAFEILFAPTDTTSLVGATWTRSHLVLNVLDDVKARLSVLTPTASGWKRSAFVGAPSLGSVAVSPLDSIDSDAVWLTAEDNLTPTTLSLAQIGKRPQRMKTLPAFFDASRFVIEQHFVTSKDGTRVPYFLVRSNALAFDGSAPTQLYGYGGFEIPMLPYYSGVMGRAWLEKGGVFALSNMRGGGEYGPRWHQAALKQNRHKAYEDMAAIAQDLVARKITSPRHLAVRGGSNGGLMAGNMLTQYPELFGAVVIEAPLLDMRRYNHLLAGASWMDEYGNPDTADWSFIQTFSPYHLFDPNKSYPPTIILTSTRDDRVHPGHARKMAAKMLDAGKDVTFYESMEGGHANPGDNAQAAHRAALMYSFLWRHLGGVAAAAEHD